MKKMDNMQNKFIYLEHQSAVSAAKADQKYNWGEDQMQGRKVSLAWKYKLFALCDRREGNAH
jgi:hypothetical protein